MIQTVDSRSVFKHVHCDMTIQEQGGRSLHLGDDCILLIPKCRIISGRVRTESATEGDLCSGFRPAGVARLCVDSREAVLARILKHQTVHMRHVDSGEARRPYQKTLFGNIF